MRSFHGGTHARLPPSKSGGATRSNNVQDSSQLAKDQGPAGRTGRKGPLVWRNMDQGELDDPSNQEASAPNRLQVTGRRKALSERARPFIGVPLRLAYGPSEPEKLDIY